MKKFFCVIMICTAFIIPITGQAEAYHIFYNDEAIQFPVSPVLHNGTIYAPVRELVAASGASVAWHPHINAVGIISADNEWTFKIDENKFYDNGRLADEDVLLLNKDNKIMVPVRFLSGLLDLEIKWEPQSNAVYLLKASDPEKTVVVDQAIMGESQATAEQLSDFLLKYNPNPKIPISAVELANTYLDEGKIEGVRGDFAFAQSIIETGYFRFGGCVLPEQYNYCGLGSTTKGVKGLYFSSPQEGIRAQIQHLKAYASTEPLNQECVDPRFDLVSRGSASHLKYLAQALNPNEIGWAYPGYDESKYNSVTEAYNDNQTYGQRIMTLINRILN